MEFGIDFDEASKAFMKNKKHLGCGTYSYVCDYINSKGKQCNRELEITMRNIKCTRCKHHTNKTSKNLLVKNKINSFCRLLSLCS